MPPTVWLEPRLGLARSVPVVFTSVSVGLNAALGVLASLPCATRNAHATLCGWSWPFWQIALIFSAGELVEVLMFVGLWRRFSVVQVGFVPGALMLRTRNDSVVVRWDRVQFPERSKSEGFASLRISPGRRGEQLTAGRVRVPVSLLPILKSQSLMKSR